MVTTVDNDCGRLTPLPSPSSGICPVVGDEFEVTCALDDMGGDAEVRIMYPDGTVMLTDVIVLENVDVSDMGLYTCIATNDLCTPSNDTIFIDIFGK